MDPSILAFGLALVAVGGLMATMHWRRRPEFDQAKRESLLDFAAINDSVANASLLTDGPPDGERIDPLPVSSSAEVELDFRRRQYRRRMQASLMIGAVGIVLVAGEPLRNSAWYLIYAVILLAMVGWVMLLAVADAIASRHHFARIRHALWIEEAALISQTRQPKTQRGPTGSSGRSSRDEA